jgi:hypothetical protein
LVLGSSPKRLIVLLPRVLLDWRGWLGSPEPFEGLPREVGRLFVNAKGCRVLLALREVGYLASSVRLEGVAVVLQPRDTVERRVVPVRVAGTLRF